jgi:hypothetical protein
MKSRSTSRARRPGHSGDSYPTFEVGCAQLIEEAIPAMLKKRTEDGGSEALRNAERKIRLELALKPPTKPRAWPGRARRRQANLGGPQRQQVRQVGRAECGPLLFAHEASLRRGVPLKQRQRHSTRRREVLRPVAPANRTRVIAEADVERPMQLVLHRLFERHGAHAPAPVATWLAAAGDPREHVLEAAAFAPGAGRARGVSGAAPPLRRGRSRRCQGGGRAPAGPRVAPAGRAQGQPHAATPHEAPRSRAPEAKTPAASARCTR